MKREGKNWTSRNKWLMAGPVIMLIVLIGIGASMGMDDSQKAKQQADGKGKQYTKITLAEAVKDKIARDQGADWDKNRENPGEESKESQSEPTEAEQEKEKTQGNKSKGKQKAQESKKEADQVKGIRAGISNLISNKFKKGEKEIEKIEIGKKETEEKKEGEEREESEEKKETEEKKKTERIYVIHNSMLKYLTKEQCFEIAEIFFGVLDGNRTFDEAKDWLQNYTQSTDLEGAHLEVVYREEEIEADETIEQSRQSGDGTVIYWEDSVGTPLVTITEYEFPEDYDPVTNNTVIKKEIIIIAVGKE